MIKFLQMLIASFLLVTVCSQTCSNVPNNQDLIQTGSLLLTDPTPNSTDCFTKAFTYSIPITYSVPSTGIQTTASISDYALSNPTFGYDFSLRAGPDNISNTVKIVLLTNHNHTWTRVRISYFISSCKNMFVGIFTVNNLFIHHKNNTKLSLKYALPNWKSTNQQVMAIVSFSGIRTISNFKFSINFTKAVINNQNGLLTLQLLSKNIVFFQFIQISYICLKKGSSLTFKTFNQNLNTYAAYPFVGLGSINDGIIIYKGIGFDRANSMACVGNRCPSECVSTTICNNLLNLNATTCFLCGAGQTFNNVSLNCDITIFCGNYEYFDGIKCKCANNFYFVNGQCFPSCGLNAYLDSAKICQCIYAIQFLSNASDLNSTQTLPTCEKVTPCPYLQVYNSNKKQCQCLKGYARIDSGCRPMIKCGNNYYWNPTYQTCTCYGLILNGVCQSCPINQVWRLNKCVCLYGYYYINGESGCACKAGYYIVNRTCQACSSNSHSNGVACICNTGFSFFGSICVSSSSCPANSQWNRGKCVCIGNYYQDGNKCSQCPPVAKSNGYWCYCQNLFTYLFNGSCIPCPNNMIYDGKQCICLPNFYVRTPNGLCVICPPKQQWNGTDCVCLPHFYPSKNGCDSCLSNCESCTDSNTCIKCSEGYILSYNNNTSKATCSLFLGPISSSKLTVTGTVIAKEVVYQGVKLSRIPFSLLAVNCANCSDILLVTAITEGITIKTAIQYVLNSQYWFIITFGFGPIDIIPVFQFTVQINPIYASSFTSIDIITNSKTKRKINPNDYDILPTNTDSTASSKSTLAATTKDMATATQQLQGSINLSTATVQSSAILPALSTTAQIISKEGVKSNIQTSTMLILFG